MRAPYCHKLHAEKTLLYRVTCGVVEVLYGKNLHSNVRQSNRETDSQGLSSVSVYYYTNNMCVTNCGSYAGCMQIVKVMYVDIFS